MNMTRSIWVAVYIMTAGIPLQLIGKEPAPALKQGQIGGFADVLMAQDPSMTLAVVTMPLPPFSAEHVRIKGGMEALR